MRRYIAVVVASYSAALHFVFGVESETSLVTLSETCEKKIIRQVIFDQYLLNNATNQ